MSAFSALIFLARSHALTAYDAADVPAASVVEAIIEHESRGRARLCVNEHDGSSSRGPMQLNRKHSRCCPEDDARFAADYDPRSNIERGVRLLAFQAAWARLHDYRGDALELYAGRGPAARRFAHEIRELARELEAEGPS